MWTIAWSAALAQDVDPEDVEEIEVVGEKPPDTATERSLDREAVESFPAASADELLRAVPGLHLSAHGGNGKAFQFLVRGFDAEHGTDLLVTVEGVPVNEPSNVHGQGYIDLHFLPLVLVDGLDLVKGSYRARDGDFAIIGAADYAVGLEPEGLLLESHLGSDRSGGGTVAWRPREAGEGTFLVAEAEGAIGVGDGRRYTQLRAAAGVDGELGAVKVFAYDGAFESPGVLRTDDLELGEIGFYDAYEVANGGASRRLLAIGSLSSAGERGSGEAVAWAGARTLALDQNYSGWLDDPVHGDGTRQSEEALDGGVRLEGTRLVDALGRTWALRAGADGRLGSVAEAEDAVTPEGRIRDTLLDGRARQLGAGAWTEGRLLFGGILTLVPGLRADRVELWYRDVLAGEESYARSGATVISPKGTAAVHAGERVTLFASGGRGFRSPDARGIADGDTAPVVRSDSAETGARVEPVDGLTLSATGFSIGISNELVFDHLAGRFLSAGRTRRLGVEAVVDVEPVEWLRFQGDATFTDGRFVVSDEPIPYAPRLLLAGGAFAEGAPLARGARLSGGLRAWYLGPRPLPSGFASHPSLVGTLTSTVSTDRLSVGLDVDNVFVQEWRDGEFVYPSWFDTTEARSELPVLHVTAGDPFAVRATLGARF